MSELVPSPVFEVIAENEYFVVINKTAAVSFHCENDQIGLFEQVKQQLFKLEHKTAQLYPLHRLDKLTTGLLIMAKTAKVAKDLGQLFESREIDKYYVALSDQKPKKKQGWVKGDMTKARRGAYKLLRSNENPAVSQFISAALSSKSSQSNSGNSGQRLYLIKPHSGKTHQIRVALKSIGAPILGDELYGGSKQDRGYLHAFAIRFELYQQHYQWCVLPSSGKWFKQTPVIEQLTQTWHQPWSEF